MTSPVGSIQGTNLCSSLARHMGALLGFFPTPYTPQGLDTFNVPVGAANGRAQGDYILQTYGLGTSGSGWRELKADSDTKHDIAAYVSGGFAGPLLQAEGVGTLRSGSWRYRHEADPTRG